MIIIALYSNNTVYNISFTDDATNMLEQSTKCACRKENELALKKYS
jgi:hypothetical protein